MQNRMILILLIAVLLLASCGESTRTPLSASEELSSKAEPSSEIQASDFNQSSDNSSGDTNYPFYGDNDFMQKAYAMGYSDSLLKLCWDVGHTKESLLHPPVFFLYDVSPDEKWSLYQGATPDGGMMLGLEHVCLKNNETGEIIVLGAKLTEQGPRYANVCFCSNDCVSFFDAFGGSVYSLQGEEILLVAFNPEASGYSMYNPVYNPQTNRIIGLGTDFKTENFIINDTDEDLIRTFSLIEFDTSGKMVNGAITGIPMEVNRYNQIVTPSATYVRDGYLWIALTTDDGYPFYRIDIADTYDVKLVDSADFRAVFPHYVQKG